MTEIVSASVSPFLPSEVFEPSAKPTTEAPKRCIELSNDRRVRVEASKKQLAITLCFNSSGCGLAFRLAAVSSTSSRSSRLRSLIEIMCFWYSGLAIVTSSTCLLGLSILKFWTKKSPFKKGLSSDRQCNGRTTAADCLLAQCFVTVFEHSKPVDCSWVLPVNCRALYARD